MNKHELKAEIELLNKDNERYKRELDKANQRIKELNAEIEALEADKRRMTHSISEIDKYFERVKREVAFEIITHGTHRDRDLYYKHQVLNMVTIQEVFTQSLFVTDDIPF